MNPFWDFCSLYHTFKPIDKCFVNSLSKHDCIGVCIHWMQRIPLKLSCSAFFLLEWRKWKLSKLSKRKQDVYAAPEADFLPTFFCKLFDCHCVLASSFLLFNKCITTARLALSHREKKMLYNAKIQNISLIYINKLKNLWLLSAFTVISVNNFCRWSCDKSSILSVNQYQFILWHRKTTSLWSFRECFKSSNVFSWWY